MRNKVELKDLDLEGRLNNKDLDNQSKITRQINYLYNVINDINKSRRYIDKDLKKDAKKLSKLDSLEFTNKFLCFKTIFHLLRLHIKYDLNIDIDIRNIKSYDLLYPSNVVSDFNRFISNNDYKAAIVFLVNYYYKNDDCINNIFDLFVKLDLKNKAGDLFDNFLTIRTNNEQEKLDIDFLNCMIKDVPNICDDKLYMWYMFFIKSCFGI